MKNVSIISNGRFCDLVFGKNLDNQEYEDVIIIDMTGVNIGSGFITGYLAKQYRSNIHELDEKRVKIVLNNIMDANPDDILSPGIMFIFGAEIGDLPDNLDVVITNAIERRK